VTYEEKTGNLTILVPHGPAGARLQQLSRPARLMDADGPFGIQEADGDLDDMDDVNEMMPPVLQAMRDFVPMIMEGVQRQQQMPEPSSFMRSGPRIALGGFYPELARLHPRFHAPPGGEVPLPRDVVVNRIGCFAESQLAKTQLKYYGDSNAASFRAMYWHAINDGVQYFAMARHAQPLGHAFTFKDIAQEKPAWSAYDTCGTPCADTVKLLHVSQDNCEKDNSRVAEVGGAVIRCKLDPKDVSQIPIKVIDDEL